MMALAAALAVPLDAGSLLSVNPTGASVGVAVQITGSGFNTSAASNAITFSPADGSTPVTVPATAIATVDATQGLRRVNVTVPNLPIGTAALRVTNTATGDVSDGLNFDVLSLSLPDVTSAPVGTTSLQIVLAGSSHTDLTGTTASRVSFGAGVTVRTVTVTSPQRMLATVDVAPTAAPGPRSIAVRPLNQSLLATNAFTITPAGTPNRAPVANAGGPYQGLVSQPLTLSGAGSQDPDADPLVFSWTFGDGSSSTDPNPVHTYAVPGTFTVTLSVSDGKGGSNTASTSATIVAPPVNRPPRITSQPVLSSTVAQPYQYQVQATDDDGDSLVYGLDLAPSGMTIDPSVGLIRWTPLPAQSGDQPVTVRVSDGHGGSVTQAYTVHVQGPVVTLSSIGVAPASLRFSSAGSTQPLSVTGRRSDNSTVDLTAAAAGTTYESSNPFVASVDTGGVVTAIANGDATITARNASFAGTAAASVEIGVTLDTLELAPATTVLRQPGALQSLTLTGRFSDGTSRILTTAAGATFDSSDSTVASVSASGAISAVARGTATITATYAGARATAQVQVELAEPPGFLRGAAFDDSRGLPLAGATIALLSDGGGPVSPGTATVSDDRGRFVLPGRGGNAVVRVSKSGFTTVDRQGVIPAGGVGQLLDARLTPVDPTPNALRSVFGGRAQDSSGAFVVDVPAGAMGADALMRVTPIGPQGLAGRLPLGWSPVGAADISPGGVPLSQAATLTLPNAASLAPGTPLTFVFYDGAANQWVAQGAAQVGTDGRTLAAPVSVSGQFAFVIGDQAPFVPPAPIPGHSLEGVQGVELSDQASASGDVIPRSAPPGDGARAVGRVGLQSPVPVPSGTALQVHVDEQFDLTDATSVVPLPFTQDILVHARPRPPTGGALGATFVISPSRSHTIQELLHGVVKLNVTRSGVNGGGIVAASGATITTATGEALTVPAGALPADSVVGLTRTPDTGLLLPTPPGFDLLDALDVDVVGVSFATSARLSIPLPAGIAGTDQVLVALAFVDPLGVRRLRLVGFAQSDGTRLTSGQILGTLVFPGIIGGGQYLFFKVEQPVGFVTGLVTGVGGTPVPLALVSSDNAPFVDVTGADGRYVVAGRPAIDTHLAASNLLSRDSAAATVQIPARDAVVTLSLTLAVVPPSVSATSPAAGAVNVPLDTSIAIDFSTPLDPATITEQSVVLQTGGASVSISRVLSQDRRRLVLRPASSLLGKSTYTLTLTTGVKDPSGVSLVPFAPVSFVTLDPTKPPQPPIGQIAAGLPDVDGLVLVFGNAGSADPGSPVTGTNLRTQETITVIASADGSFRFRLAALVGDEITLTFRDAAGRETTVPITQFVGEDGTTSIGVGGGAVQDASGRVASILPRALTSPGLFKLGSIDAPAAPALSGGLTYADHFTLQVEGAAFNRLGSLTLSEGQNRFAPVTAADAPFQAAGELTVPSDFLVNGSVRVTARAQDIGGAGRTATGSTLVIASGAASQTTESAYAADFPSVFVTAPVQATPGQVIDVHAVAPVARLDLTVPAPAVSADQFFLTRVTTIAGEIRLQALDSFERQAAGSSQVLRTSGHVLPGMTVSGEYAIVRSTQPLVLITGRLIGPAGAVSADGLPFVSITDGPNATFVLPVLAGQPFTLRFFGSDGSSRGTATGQAPATGALDIGDPLSTSTGQLHVTVDPDERSVVDIGQPLVLRFSEPVDMRTLSGSALVVTDDAGVRIFGAIATTDGGRSATFRPARRWRFGSTYHYGVTTTVTAISGARLGQAVTGRFTTFLPLVLANLPEGSPSDVSVSGAVGLLSTDAGAALVDLTAPAAPVTVGRAALAGGARAGALSTSSLIDRNGQPVIGPVALIVSGDAVAGGRVSLYSLAAPALPVFLGASQLTVAAGQPPAQGVLQGSGTPREVVVSDDRAWVAIESVGVASLRLGQMVPDSPATPSQALGPRYPTQGAESITGVALLGDRLVAAGASGLTILDAVTLERRGILAADAGLRKIAVVPSFAFDINGDGAIAPDSEVFDLGIAAGGADGTVQFFRIPPAGDPSLLSVVRFPGETTSVAINADERLAYIGLGARGIGVVDLDGPASIQPIDVDRNGIDDRVLGTIAKPGSAARIALAVGGRIAAVADGLSGLTTVQLLPPKTTFVDVLRDPVQARVGDEQSILESGAAFTSDEAVQVKLSAALPPGGTLSLSLDEAPESGGPRRLSFADGGLAVPLADGPTTAIVLIRTDPAPTGSHATLRVRTADGSIVASFEFDLVAAGALTSPLRSLAFNPDSLVLDATEDRHQLVVSGVLADGRTVNVTSASSGTTYAVANPLIALVTPDGLLVPLAGGTTDVYATHAGIVAAASVRVLRAPVLQALLTSAPHMTLTALGATGAVGTIARFTDGTSVSNLQTIGTVFESSDTSVATVDAFGVVTAVGPGVAVIAMHNGSISSSVEVSVEPRTAASLSAIHLAPVAAPVTSDEGTLDARATVEGTGSLEGLSVAFVAGSGAPVQAVTDYAGVAIARLGGLVTPGSLTLRASVINPSSGLQLADTQTVVVVAGGADAEPNDTIAQAIALKAGRQLAGTLGGADLTDIYRSDNHVAGTLTARIALSDSTDPATVTIRFLSADGSELGRQALAARAAQVSQAVEAGPSYIAIQTGGAAVSYTLQLQYAQGPLVIASVTPPNGAPGTSVTIDGSGFSLEAADVRVLFGGIVGRVSSSGPSRIVAVVPASAVDGSITLIVRDRRQTGPRFIVGNAGPRAPITLLPPDAPAIRFDPITGVRLDISRLTIYLDPGSDDQQAAVLAASLGGQVVGRNPVLNSYVLEFRGVTTIEGMESIARQLAQSPQVTRVTRVVLQTVGDITIDARDLAGNFAGTSVSRAIAYLQARVFDAIQAIRETPPYVGFGAVFQPVKIAVVDTGFSPFSAVDFQSAGVNLVELRLPDSNGIFHSVQPAIGNDPDGHGTQVTSVIASLNDGDSRLSGGYGGLFEPGEASFHVDVFGAVDGTGKLWDTAVLSALTEIASQGDVDVLNLSFGAAWAGTSASFTAAADAYTDIFALMGGKTLVVAAVGNDGVQAQFQLPSALESSLPNVMGIGATAVANLDGSGEGADARAVFAGSSVGTTSAPCTVGLAAGGSNCGPGVTMAAPGEDVLVATTGAPGFDSARGTSFAAPLVASVAALLKAIGPATGLAPDLLRTLLVDSGDDITSTWGTGQTMRRLDALNAVRLLLPPSASQMIYVADEDADNGVSSLPGRIIGIDIDPMTGLRPTPPNPDVIIPLTFTKTTAAGVVSFAGTQPTSLAVEPGGDKLYAVVKGGGSLGDGVLVVNTHSNQPVDFVPFSGAGFPATTSGTQPAPVLAASLRPGMVFSKDGRLLYVATGSGITIVNTVEDKVVRAFSDLPAIYKTEADSVQGATLADRLKALAAIVQQGIAGRPGFLLSALALSPDGKVLYGAVNTGGGGGQQPGGLLAISVDLYTDAKPDEPGLQSDLTQYLLPLTTNGAVPMQDAGSFLGGDEPGALAVSRDGQHVYMVNGGLDFFEAVPPADLDLAKYNFLLIGPAMSVLGAAGGIGGVITATAGFMNTANQLYNDLVQDIKQQAVSGLTFVSAPGVTGVFDGITTATSTVAETWLYPSDVGFGWNPSPANGGLIVDQFRFRGVFAKRPFDMGMRPDGKRALVPFFQTGNFGVVDLDAQAGFLAPPGSTPKPGLASLPTSQFQAVVGVTPALRFDNHVWPSSGAFRSAGSVVPSPDEHKLFPWHAEYAQNGRFAVASHAGNDAPHIVTATIPDFVNNNDDRVTLLDLGGTFNGTTMTIVEDGQPVTVAPGDIVQLKRGGGAISIINDQKITDDLDANAPHTINAENGTIRPFFATAPICDVRNAGDPTHCDTEPMTTLVDYTTSGATTRFHRPRGITVEPFLVFAQPRSGDHVGQDTVLQLSWRDARVQQLFVLLLDPTVVGPDGEPSLVGQLGGQLTQQQIVAMTATIRVGDFFPPQTPPQQGRTYLLQARVMITTPILDELSNTAINLVYDDQTAPPTSDALQLRPFLVPVLTVPTAQGQFKQLTTTLLPADGTPPQDVTASADTTYLWLGDLTGQIVKTSNPLVNTAMKLAGIDVTAIVNGIKSKLQTAGVPVDFTIADITVDSHGQLRVAGAGLQIIEAVHSHNGSLLFSAPIVVLAGLELTKIDLEPDSLLNDVASVTGAETLVKKVADKLGKKVNTPLILTATDPGAFSFLSNKGAIDLEDAEFTYLGAGTISISDLVAAIEPIVRKRLTQVLGGPLSTTGQIGGRLGAKVISLLINEVLTEATLQFVDLKTSDAAVATVVNDTFSGTAFKGTVNATGSGLAAIKGKLDLGDFGSASDAVPVFVLPNLTQAVVDPTNTVICRSDDASPGPKIHTFATLSLADKVTITPGQLGLTGTGADLAKLLVPAVLPTGTFYDVTFGSGDFKFGFTGTVTVDSGAVTFLAPQFRFYVPNVPGVTNRYELFPPGDPQSPGTVSIGGQELFAVHLIQSHVAGKNQINNFVQIPGLGSVQGIGSVTVTDICNTPFVVKELPSGTQSVAPGDQLSYLVTVGNSTAAEVDNVTIQETATYFAGAPTGNPADDAIEVTQTIPVGTLAAQSSIQVPIVIQAFGNAPGTIQNRASASGSVPIIPVDRCHLDPTAPGCNQPQPTPCQLHPEAPNCHPSPEPQPYCATHPADPKCVCAQTPRPAECDVQPPPVVVLPALPFITEMVLDPKQDWSDSSGGNGVPFDAVPGTATPDGNDVWIEVAAVTGTTNWTLTLTDATGATFSKIVGPPVFGSTVKVVSGFGVGSARIVTVQVTDQNGLVRQTVDVAAIEAVLGPATGASNESLTWSIFGSPTPVLQQFLRRAATIGIFNPF